MSANATIFPSQKCTDVAFLCITNFQLNQHNALMHTGIRSMQALYETIFYAQGPSARIHALINKLISHEVATATFMGYFFTGKCS